jgi:hypothetical protein
MLADVYTFIFSFERLELRSMLILVLVDISIIDHEHMHVDYHNYDNFEYGLCFIVCAPKLVISRRYRRRIKNLKAVQV